MASARHAPQGENEKEQPHAKVEHEKQRGERDAVIEAFRLPSRLRGQGGASALPLVFQYFVQYQVGAGDVALLHLVAEEGEHVGYECPFLSGSQAVRHVVSGRVPCDVLSRVHGEHLERLAPRQVHHHHQPSVKVSGLPRGLVLLSAVVLLDVWAKDISSPLVVEEIVHGASSRQGQGFSQLLALHGDDGLPRPFFTIEKKSRQHLFGRVALVAGLAAELLGEVYGEGLHGAYPVVVHYI